jgi:hypothetical protein
VRHGVWASEEYHTFGASIVHRRHHFKDQAIENRSIWLHIPFNSTRPKKSYYPVDGDMVKYARELLEEACSITLPEADIPGFIAPRVAEAYEPILRLAQLVDDMSFLAELGSFLSQADAAFRDGQTYEPKALALQALIACLTETDPTTNQERLKLDKSVKVMEICNFLQRNYQQGLTNRQAAAYLRELWFQTGMVGGVTRVRGITVPQLVRACQETGIVDELVAKVAKGTP